MSSVIVADLDAEHRNVFNRAITAVLGTEGAELTYAQIIDGVPLVSVYRDSKQGLHTDHPLYEHTDLCPGAREKAKEYRDAFNPDHLGFDSRLAQAFQDAEIGSVDFNMRLIEMVAVAVHRIAVVLHQANQGKHQDIISWVLVPTDEVRNNRLLPPRIRNPQPPDTLFSHSQYKYKDAYPEGVSDMVGYWAENRILGGVVLFGRGPSGFGCDGVYFHSDRLAVTYRIYKLLDSQVEALLDFLLGLTHNNPLPITGDEKNRDRIDPVDAIEEFSVFRDPWEREPTPAGSQKWNFMKRRPRDALDYPEIEDKRKAVEALFRDKEAREGNNGR